MLYDVIRVLGSPYSVRLTDSSQMRQVSHNFPSFFFILFYFFFAIWLPYGQLWAIVKGTASLT